MLNQINTWNKIGRIVYGLSVEMNISMEQALDVFYTSKTCKEFHNPGSGLYLMSDKYIIENLRSEVVSR